MPKIPPTPTPRKPHVFIDADVLFAGSAAPSQSGASLVVLRMAEITLIEAHASEQVIAEARRNLAAKLPQALPSFNMIVARCLHIVPDPEHEIVEAYAGLADPADLPILVAALQNGCPWLVTFNTRHYRPGHPEVAVLPPGDFVLQVRDLLTRLS